MADSLKAQKLAAARKKLKEFQQKKVPKENNNATSTNEISSSGNSLASSTHSLANTATNLNDSNPIEALDVNSKHEKNTIPSFDTPVLNTSEIFNPIANVYNSMPVTNTSPINLPNAIADDSLTSSPANVLNTIPANSSTLDYSNTANLQNYFNSMNMNNTEMQMNFFDNCNQNTVGNYLQAAGDNKSSNVIENNVPNVAMTMQSPEQFFSYEIRDADVQAEDYPELKHNEVFDRYNQVNLNQQEFVPSSQPPQLFESKSNINETSADYEIAPPVEYNNATVQSNLESLNQLSSQLHHMVSDYDTHDMKHNSEMEKRNQELAALLDQEQIKAKELQVQLQEYKQKIENLESESRQSKLEAEEKVNKTIGPLQEQLQYHMQTVGILVAEKTELTASLSQSQILAKQKVSECEELQGRLKASRSRVADLEKELNVHKAEKYKYDQIGSEKNEIVDNLNIEIRKMKEEKEELAQDLSEMKEKLNISTSENFKLQHEIQELNAQLSLANVKIQQLATGNSAQGEVQIEDLVQQKLLLEKNIVELQQTIKSVTAERDQASIQYQQYTEQLNTQLSNIAQKLETTSQQNESLVKREQELVHHIGELEKHLQSVQNDHVNFSTYKNNNTLKKDLEDANQQLEEVQKQNQNLCVKLENLSSENEDLLKELAAKKDVIVELESKIERLEGNQPDSAKLLAAMESDKVAAARAVQQNTQLKKQLEDMEEVFIKLSNDKLELTEQLANVQYQNREISEKLQQTEHQLHTLAEAIEIKDRELTLIRQGSTELNKQVLEQNQLADRLRHYEAQEHTITILQKDLNDALQQIEEFKKKPIENSSEAIETTNNESQTQSIPNGTDQIDSSNNELLNKVTELEELNRNLQNQLELVQANQSTIVNQTDHDKENGIADHINHINKDIAMQQLEEKFKKTMEEIANLQDEKQRLEHVVLQLQGETETIGEYIALYRHQRGILKQRTVEKENQLKKIANDREEMRMKLEQLNSLIRRMIVDNNGSVSNELLEQHREINESTLNQQAYIDEHYTTEPASTPNGQEANDKNRTAQKIIDLLCEIKTNELVSPTDGSDGLHHCPCCSGHLITI